MPIEKVGQWSSSGIAVAKILLAWGVGKLLLVNRAGILRPGRTDLNPVQEALAAITNPEGKSGTLAEAFVGADIFIHWKNCTHVEFGPEGSAAAAKDVEGFREP